MSGIRRLKPGQVVRDLKVVRPIAEVRGRHPVYLVWSQSHWCMLACKMFVTNRRAEREWRVIDDLNHPNIIRTMGLRSPGMMLTEVLDGPTLEQYAASRPQGRLGVADALRSAFHIGSALNHVHSRGYVHLDVKPGNVILESGRPVLFDFGSARRIGAKRPSSVVGTTPFIAPEECLLGEATPASDVFGLGVTLYELLTGEFPYADETKESPYPQLLDPRPLRQARPSVPRGVEEVVMACLARRPEDRPALTDLLPRMNDLIGAGPRMWPQDFDPVSVAA